MIDRLAVAVTTSVTGSTMAGLAAVIAQSQPSGDLGALAPWASVAGSGAAVAGIVYIARLMATGKLVARDPALAEAEQLKTTQRLLELLDAANTREDRFYQYLSERAKNHGRSTD